MQTAQFFHGSSRPEAGSRAGLSQFHWMSCQEADKSQQGGASGVTEKQLGDWPRIAHQKWWIEVFEKWGWIPKNQKDATLFGTLIGIWFNWTWRFAEKDGKINAALETHPVWGCNVVVWGIPGRSSARRPILPAASAPRFITCYDPHWLVRNIYRKPLGEIGVEPPPSRPWQSLVIGVGVGHDLLPRGQEHHHCAGLLRSENGKT